MKSYIYLSIFFVVSNLNAQIKWTTVPKSTVDPYELIADGQLELNNNDITPMSKLYINFINEKIYYRNDESNSIFSIFKDEFSKISISDYYQGNWVKRDDFYGDIGEEVGAALRKKLYLNAALNLLNITSVEKEGFFNRKKPKFQINKKNGELDVQNKASINTKLLRISPEIIEYLDEDGDLWLRSQKRAKKVTIDDEESKKEKKERRKIARVLNIQFQNDYYINTRELYNHFYKEYEKNFLESLNDFKEAFIGRKLTDLLLEWGPVSEKIDIANNQSIFIWSFERKITEAEGYSNSSTDSKILSLFDSQTSSSGSISSYYGIDTSSSKLYLGGYGNITKSFSNINGRSFLNYYSRNVSNQYIAGTSISSGQSYSTSVQIDDTKKIAVIVDNSTSKIIEVLEKNYFSLPYYGITISFVD